MFDAALLHLHGVEEHHPHDIGPHGRMIEWTGITAKSGRSVPTARMASPIATWCS
jgi:hypothetical protein